MAYVAVCLHYVEKCLPDALTLKGKRMEVGTYLCLCVSISGLRGQVSAWFSNSQVGKRGGRYLPMFVCVCLYVWTTLTSVCMKRKGMYLPVYVCVCFSGLHRKSMKVGTYICMCVCLSVFLSRLRSLVPAWCSNSQVGKRGVGTYLCLCVCVCLYG